MGAEYYECVRISSSIRYFCYLLGWSSRPIWCPGELSTGRLGNGNCKFETGLVAEMSECVMAFVAELGHCHPLAKVERTRPIADTPGSLSGLADVGSRRTLPQKPSEVLTQSYRNFDVCRCAIGTKLEVYYPDVCGKTTIHRDWQNFADTLIELYNLHRLDGACFTEFADRLRTTLGKLGEPEKRRAEARAEERKLVVDVRWGIPEQCLLSRKTQDHYRSACDPPLKGSGQEEGTRRRGRSPTARSGPAISQLPPSSPN